VKRTLRHPIRGDFHYRKPSSRPSPQRSWRANAPQLRIRSRKGVHVGDLVGSPEDEPSRPSLRLKVVRICFVLLFGVLVLRLWSLQVVNGKNYAAAVSSNAVRTVTVSAARGQIVDRNGALLAGNVPDQEILLSQAEATQHPAIVGMAAALVGQTPTQVKAALNDSQYSPYEPVPIETNASAATVEYLQMHQSAYPGVTVKSVSQRTYPSAGTLAPDVVGYVGDATSTEVKANPKAGYTQGSQVGQTGIEAQYNKELGGTNGNQELEVNSLGDVVGTLSTTAPTTGDTVVLNIDSGLQAAVQTALQNDVTTDQSTVDPKTGKRPAANTAAAVVLNVQTGAVLALASDPAYNLDEWVGGISQANYSALSASGALNNDAIQGLYTPGSSFKLATATAGVQTGLVNPNAYFDDPGTFKIPPPCSSGCTFHDNSQSDAGEINLPFALTESDDDYFYNIGNEFYDNQAKYGATPIQNVANEYGLGELTGIDLPGEAQGRVDSLKERELLHTEAPAAFAPATWYAGDSIEMAFGQGATVLTPIEQAQAYATFANGGTRYAPEVAAALVNPTTNKVIKKFEPKVTGHVSLPASIYDPILQGLEGVVDNPAGTAYGTFRQYANFSLNQFRIAGKTGTADVSVGGAKEPDAWFVGFGPIPNPQYVVVVAVGEGGYGANAAAPAVMNIFNYLVAHPIGAVALPPASIASSTTTSSTTGPTGAISVTPRTTGGK